MNESDNQLRLCLAPRATNEVISERLADAVERFNNPLAAPEERIELHHEIRRLRSILGKDGAR